MNLYQLSDEYQQLLDLASKAETPEDETAFADTMQGLAGEIEKKVIGCAAVYKTLLAEAAVFKTEEDRLSKLRRSRESNADRLKSYMQQGMETATLKQVKGELFTVAIQNNNPTVIIDSPELVPDIYKKTETVTSITKKEILDALKADRVIPGCHMEQGQSLRIR